MKKSFRLFIFVPECLHALSNFIDLYIDMDEQFVHKNPEEGELYISISKIFDNLRQLSLEEPMIVQVCLKMKRKLRKSLKANPIKNNKRKI